LAIQPQADIHTNLLRPCTKFALEENELYQCLLLLETVWHVVLEVCQHGCRMRPQQHQGARPVAGQAEGDGVLQIESMDGREAWQDSDHGYDGALEGNDSEEIL